MSEVRALILLVPALPLLSAIITALFGPRFLGRYSHLPTIIATACSCVVSIVLLIGLKLSDTGGYPSLEADGYTWFSSTLLPRVDPSAFQVTLSFQLDTLSAVMLIAITFVGTWI